MFKRLLKPLYPFIFILFLIVQRALKKKKFLILWNRGLGDIALGLYGLNQRIRDIIPDAQITYITREDLKEGFELLPNCTLIVDPSMQRGVPYKIDTLLSSQYDVVIKKANPTDWLRDQIGRVVPKLKFTSSKQNEFREMTVGIHVQTETGQYYGYNKNWPVAAFFSCIEALNEKGIVPILFGLYQNNDFEGLQVRDLRGKTTLLETLSVITNDCHTLLVPDSGILSLTYYLDHSFPIHLVSIWSDPNQGVLKQKVPSPNPRLKHTVLIEKDLNQLKIEHVLKAIVC
jgi:ADP-heptose:LPS heptosyltransferase